jgi:hypothetical protein
MKVIVFTNDADKISIISPSSNCGLAIEEIAEKDTPVIVLERDEQGILIKTEPRQYLIIDDSELPDRELRDRWAIHDGKVIVKDEVEA